MKALGVRFLDENGAELNGCGADLINIRSIDVSGLDPRIAECRFTVMCDVKNPLCGKDGATYTFGKQKGGTPEKLQRLEAGMCNYRNILQKQFGINMDEVPGAGAAGGLGAALMVFLHGRLRSGIETVLDLVGFDQKLQGVSLVVTGEGAVDWQSVFGKVRCRNHGYGCVDTGAGYRGGRVVGGCAFCPSVCRFMESSLYGWQKSEQVEIRHKLGTDGRPLRESCRLCGA